MAAQSAGLSFNETVGKSASTSYVITKAEIDTTLHKSIQIIHRQYLFSIPQLSPIFLDRAPRLEK